MRKTTSVVLAIFMCALCFTTNAQISGTVFLDVNGNGIKTASAQNGNYTIKLVSETEVINKKLIIVK